MLLHNTRLNIWEHLFKNVMLSMLGIQILELDLTDSEKGRNIILEYLYDLDFLRSYFITEFALPLILDRPILDASTVQQLTVLG